MSKPARVRSGPLASDPASVAEAVASLVAGAMCAWSTTLRLAILLISLSLPLACGFVVYLLIRR